MASIARTDAENKLPDVTIGKYSLEESDSGAVKNTSSVHFNRAFSQFKKIYDLFEHANRVLQRGSISNSLIGYISLDEHAHESHHHWFLIELVDDLFRTHSFPVNCLPGIDGSSSNHLPLWNINSDRCLTVDTLRPNTIRSKLSVSFFFFFVFYFPFVARSFFKRCLRGLRVREKSTWYDDLTLRFVSRISHEYLSIYRRLISSLFSTWIHVTSRDTFYTTVLNIKKNIDLLRFYYKIVW